MNYEILIYSEAQNSRTDYVFSYLFSDLLGLSMHSTASREEADSFEGPVIYYTTGEILGKLCIHPSGLLSEKTVKAQSIKTGKWDDLTVLFADDPALPVPFDIFSASFWLMSRYEEYLEHSNDAYGRFPARESFAFRAGFLDLPVVNLWTIKLSEVLRRFYPTLKTKNNRFQWMASIDVDRAWAFRNKGIKRTVGGLVKSFFSGRNFIKRLSVLRGKEADPFYTFDAIRAIHSGFPEKLLIFVLSGKPGRYDPNSCPDKPEFKTLVASLGKEYQLGIHPSFRSNDSISVLKEEFETLSTLLPYPLKNSRQHFLKIKLPLTYRNLITLGIQEDYSMGYPGQPGFRAGVCTPFQFYDLEKEEKTNLKLWPVTLMDRTLKDYLHKAPDESIEIIKTYIDIVEKAGGWFIPIWHNDSLSDYGEWKDWKNVYVQMIETLKSKS
jgi:hypothetical protein